MTAWKQIRAIVRLDLAEVLRSRWLALSGVVYLALAVVFISVGQQEAPLLGFTGSARVLFSLGHALVLVLPLFSLVATAPTVGRAREDGSLELLFSQPLSRGVYLVALSAVRMLAIVAPLAVLFVIVGMWGWLAHGQPVPWAYVGRSLGVLVALAWAFAGLGLLISATVRNPVRTITYIVLIWATAVALVDAGMIGALLRWRVEPHAVFTLAALNPVEDARLALLSGLEHDLTTLGPVGVYVSRHVGDGALYALGLAGPIAWGTLAWLAAYFQFRRNDLV